MTKTLSQVPAYIEVTQMLAKLRSRQTETLHEIDAVKARLSEAAAAAKDPMRQADLLLEGRGGFDDAKRLQALNDDAKTIETAIAEVEHEERKVTSEASAAHCRLLVPAHLQRMKALLAALEQVMALNAADVDAIREIERAGFQLAAGIAPVQFMPFDLPRHVDDLRKEVHLQEARLMPESSQNLTVRMLTRATVDDMGRFAECGAELTIPARWAHLVVAAGKAEFVASRLPEATSLKPRRAMA